MDRESLPESHIETHSQRIGLGDPPEAKKRSLWKLPALAFAVGALVAATYFNANEGYERLGSGQKDPATNDEILNVGSWNMHGEAAARYEQIDQLYKDNELDALALQEVSKDDAHHLADLLPGYVITYKLADRLQEPKSGGYGNLIMTRQEPEDIKARTLDGNNIVEKAVDSVGGLTEDARAADESGTQFRNGLKEKRSAIAEKIKIKHNGKDVSVTIVTGHVTSHGKDKKDEELHDKQMAGYLDLIKDSAGDEGAVVSAADMNSETDEIEYASDRIGLKTPPSMPATSVNSGKAIDHFMYRYGKVLSKPTIKVLKNPKTDHYPIIATFYPQPEF